MRLIPDAQNVLEKYVEILPAGAKSPLHPFGGLVVNFNVVTGAHIDGKDERFCMLFVIQEGDGAEVVFLELGVVMRMQTGHSAIFRSTDITHFNLHFKGYRSSMVFHTDRDCRSWIKDRNGWQNKAYFSG